MAGKTITAIAVLFLLLSAGVQARVVYEGHLDDVCLQLIGTPRGGRVKDIPLGPGVYAATNGTFFLISDGFFKSIGETVSFGKELPSIPGPNGQAWIYQMIGGRITISETPPKDLKKCIVAAKCAPLLVRNGKVVVSKKGLIHNPERFLSNNRPRNIIAIALRKKTAGEQFADSLCRELVVPDLIPKNQDKILVVRLYRTKGDLRAIARSLVKQGVLYALNLDGGRSTKENELVANAFMFCSKTRECYKLFKEKCLVQHKAGQALLPIFPSPQKDSVLDYTLLGPTRAATH